MRSEMKRNTRALLEVYTSPNKKPEEIHTLCMRGMRPEKPCWACTTSPNKPSPSQTLSSQTVTSYKLFPHKQLLMKPSINVYTKNSKFLVPEHPDYTKVLLVYLANQDLTDTSITFPPNSIYINLDGCGIKSFNARTIPDKVEVLSMRDNNLLTMDATDLPPSIKILNLDNTTSLFKISACTLYQMQELSLYDSEVQSIDRNRFPLLADLNLVKSWDGASSNIQVVEHNYFGCISELDLHGGGHLHTFTDNGCPRLTNLDLSGNVLTSFDNSNKLPSLTHLSLSANNINSFSFVPSSDLVCLDLSNNSISGNFDASVLPSTLHTLNLSSNSIKSITGLENLVNLVNLNIGENMIKHIDLSPLVRLTTVCLSFNRLTEFNKENKPLPPNLTSLDLTGNPIQEIHLGETYNITNLTLGSIKPKHKKMRPSTENEVNKE